MPPRIARLPRDSRGYPIPWNVLRASDGTPFFTINDDTKASKAIRLGLCPICGGELGRWRWFVGGPRSAFDPHGWYLDLPGHRECMEYALQACPYLATPKYLGRVDVIHPEKLPPEARLLIDETIIPDRPELFVAACGTGIELQEREEGLIQPYVRPRRPLVDYTFWHHGQQIPLHRAMPILRGIFGENWTPPVRGEI